jgi:periplasmic protein TonB
MFEDATFETMGTIHTRSRNWMIATFGLNASMLAALVAIPLMYPSALPRMMYINQLTAPAPVEETKPVVQQAPQTASQTEMPRGVLQAPSRIPKGTWIPITMEPPMPGDLMSLGGPGPLAALGAGCDPLNCLHTQPDMHRVVQAKPRPVSSGVMEGMLIRKVIPTYPAIGRAVRAQGTVQLQATISREGTIENLRAVSGPTMLQQAAIDAVKQWRYRPYLLNGEPVEVETTINVDFKLE